MKQPDSSFILFINQTCIYFTNQLQCVFMKSIIRTLLVFTLALSISSAKSQLQKGNVLLGADIANLNLSLNTGSNFSALLNPKAAWFIKNNIALGAFIEFQLITAKG